MSRLSAEIKSEFVGLAQQQLAKACATCLALGLSVQDIERVVRDAMAGAAVRRVRGSKKADTVSA